MSWIKPSALAKRKLERTGLPAGKSRGADWLLGTKAFPHNNLGWPVDCKEQFFRAREQIRQKWCEASLLPSLYPDVAQREGPHT